MKSNCSEFYKILSLWYDNWYDIRANIVPLRVTTRGMAWRLSVWLPGRRLFCCLEMNKFCIIPLVLSGVLGTCMSFAPVSHEARHRITWSLHMQAEDLDGETWRITDTDSRRELMGKMASIILFGTAVNSANAADDKTIWLSGKPPQIPGKKSKDPKDVAGSRKDPKFLRSISDCKASFACVTQCGVWLFSLFNL